MKELRAVRSGGGEEGCRWAVRDRLRRCLTGDLSGGTVCLGGWPPLSIDFRELFR